MNTGAIYDPRDIPILTDVVAENDREFALFDAKAVHAAVVLETQKLAASLLHQAAKDIEATLFERVFDELRAQLPELIDRVLREQAMTSGAMAAGASGRAAASGAADSDT
jgi:Zn-dependent M32 family carboxypeptidase